MTYSDADALERALDELGSDSEVVGRDWGHLTEQERSALAIVLAHARDRLDALRSDATGTGSRLPHLQTGGERVARELRGWAEDIDNDCWSLAGLRCALRERAEEVEGATAPEGESGDSELLQELFLALTTVQPNLSQPYPDAPQWTPWSRWIEPVFDRLCTAISGAPAGPQAASGGSDA